MNISRRRKRRVFEDEHMIKKKGKKKKKSKGGDDIVECSSHINIIPGDLIVEILLRLPPISVVRFRRVCKEWYSLISNTDFQRTHSSSFQSQDQQHDITKNDQFLVFETTRVEFVPLTPFKKEKQHHRNLFHGLSRQPPGDLVDLGLYTPLRSNRQRFPMVECSLIDSCNGLFLYHGISYDKHGGRSDYDTGYSLYICNPITKKYLKLPNIMDEHERFFLKTAKLVFDPSISHSYKVVMVLFNGYFASRDAEYWHMYSSETCTWRLFNTRNFNIPTITDSDNFTFSDNCLRSVLLNGVLYWSDRRSGDTSLCFDVEKESFGFLPLPPKPKNYVHYCHYLGKCDGRLRLIETLRNSSNQLHCSFDVMETQPQKQEDGSVCCTWIVKYRVNDIRMVDNFLSKELHTSNILHCYKRKNRRGENEQVLLLCLDKGLSYSLIYFSLTSQKFIQESMDFERRIFFDHAFAYTPTLFPVS